LTTGTQQLKGKFSTATVMKRVDFTHEHFKLWLKPAEPFAFQPGQYCTIGTGGIERPYSIVSSPREPLLELFVEFIPPPVGQLTPLLHKLKVGDSVSIRPRAKGIFVLKPEFKSHVMVSTVTGVAPFVSMIRHHLEAPGGNPGFYVLEGASYADEYGYDAELNGLAAKHSNIKFVATCSRPQDPRNSGWRGETGRVNAIVGKYIKQWGLKPAETCIYACGNPQMIEDVKAQYEGTGFHFEEERFWKDD
jgi:ferredoxin--NADP+ reductase